MVDRVVVWLQRRPRKRWLYPVWTDESERINTLRGGRFTLRVPAMVAESRCRTPSNDVVFIHLHLSWALFYGHFLSATEMTVSGFPRRQRYVVFV